MMDLRTVLIILLLLVSEGHLQTTKENTTPPAITQTSTKQSICDCCTCPTITPPKPSPTQPPKLFHLSIIWTSTCKGNVTVSHFHSPSSSVSSSSLPLCSTSLNHVESLLVSPCESRKGCEGRPKWLLSKMVHPCYNIPDLRDRKIYRSVMLECEVQTDSQLTAYKVVTALLCCVLLVLFLIRFTRPTVRALQSRLSDRRQNRWIGPTQSHSVSYHRGKGVVQSTDKEKRFSYPALERLTVSDSREPSSNRNSDYNC